MQGHEIPEIFNQMLVEVYLSDAERMGMLFVNKTALDNLGYSFDELQQLPIHAWTSKYPNMDVGELLRPVLESDPGSLIVPYKNIHVRKDGSSYTVDVLIQKIICNDRPCLLAIANDTSELSQALEQLEAVISGSSIGYWHRDLRTNEHHVSDRWLEMIGLTREELIEDAGSLINLIHPEDRVIGDLVLSETIRDKKPYMMEFRMRHKDGRWVWIQGSGNVVEVDPLTGDAAKLYGTHVDITERKIAEIERSQYFRFFHLSQDIMMMGDGQGCLVQANPATSSILGYSDDELITSKLINYIHPEDRDRTGIYISQVRNQDQNRAKEIENRVLRKDGQYVWIAWSAIFDLEYELFLIQGRNVDEKIKIEEELKKKELKYEALAENTDDVIVQYDRQHRMVYVNQAVRITHGIKPQDFLGKTRREMGFPEELCRLWEASIEKVFVSGVPDTLIFDLDVGRGAKSVSWRAFPEMDGEGRVESVFSVSRDVTDLKKMEEEQQKTERLTSLGVLAGGIAHDFNNILTILFGNISMARGMLPANHASAQALDQAEKAFHRAMHLTSQLLTFAKGGAPVRQNVSIGELIEEVTRFDLSGSNVKLELDIPDDLWLADIDRGQVSQVFSNLTTNANQAMPGGGHLYISAENIQVEDSPFQKMAPGKYIRFTVRDEGAGIPARDLEKIFDPYFSTKQTGSGLGLATVYSVIQKHGGTIDVQSQIGEGTTFEFYLPASEDKGTQQHKEKDKPATLEMFSGRILVMDDEEMITTLAKKILEKDGFDVDTVTNGANAIAAYRDAFDSGTPYDCVIMDLTIPGGMGGAETIPEILAIDSNATVIVSSGYAADPIMANYRDYGFSGCLVKPFTLKILQELVRETLAQNSKVTRKCSETAGFSDD